MMLRGKVFVITTILIFKLVGKIWNGNIYHPLFKPIKRQQFHYRVRIYPRKLMANIDICQNDELKRQRNANLHHKPIKSFT